MNRWTRKIPVLAACALLFAGGCTSPTGFDTDGLKMFGIDAANNLVEFGSRSPDEVRRRAITGLQEGEAVVGLDYLPGDSRLHAVTSTNRLYTIDEDAVATPVGGAFPATLNGDAAGVDFDPATGALRVVASGGSNFRIGAAGADARPTYAPEDPGAVTAPRLTGIAYDTGSPATLYAIDSNRDVLAVIRAPASGVVATVGALGINVSDDLGFDIVTTRDGERAYAVLSEGRVSRLYQIDLATGNPTLLSRLASRTAVRALAVRPDQDVRP